MRGVLLTVAYNGAAFSGWAEQTGTRTVAGTLAEAIRSIDSSASGPRGASRTDAGVHARAQMAAFDAEREIESRSWVLALNSALPDDAAVRAARHVEAGFDPRFHTREKRYVYTLLLGEVRDPLAPPSWRLGYALNLDVMQREALTLIGTHDFAAFRTASDERPTTTRTLSRCDVTRDGPFVRVAVTGNAFLHKMVRIIVGTLVDVARGHLPEGTITAAYEKKDRTALGPTAPAEGLVLDAMALDLEDEGDTWPR